LHSYFVACPESPDGECVVFFTSATADAHVGDICIKCRAEDRIYRVATNVTVEDAHRQAYQQWLGGGRWLVYQNLDDGDWQVYRIAIADGSRQLLATGRQLGWGQPAGELVPLYGPHWAPGRHRDLELLDVRTGEITTALTNAQVRQAFAGWIADTFGSADTSVFFPILSPDGRRLMFKMAAVGDGSFRSPGASRRSGLLVVDRERGLMPWPPQPWEHPAWSQDSVRIVDARNIMLDSRTGAVSLLIGLPRFPGAHPTLSPCGTLLLTDTRLTPFGGDADHWGIALAELSSGRHQLLARIPGSGGCPSWRPPHPHPVFSQDGARLYFNRDNGDAVELWVAERAGGE
jgi:hypothetical protein